MISSGTGAFSTILDAQLSSSACKNGGPVNQTPSERMSVQDMFRVGISAGLQTPET